MIVYQLVMGKLIESGRLKNLTNVENRLEADVFLSIYAIVT
jgi:hypothetical protein